ncbi:hypothetical protein V6M29_08305 [Stutzerimonas chloritidismutans]|uniref:hypothetical protein n=1 Tax=Stutzerimonas TaxID=2901164 RepID=UPI002897F072|nr:hypothetical protein [Stutzerimonas nitrititolerans]
MNTELCLILTCTVDVRGISQMARSNIEDRLTDYLMAFQAWLEKSNVNRFVFIENSGYDLSEFRKIAAGYVSKEVEFISFDGQDFNRELGKGYGEMLSLQQALQSSSMLAEVDAFIKVNGRYFVPSIGKIKDKILADYDVVCDFSRHLTYADSRLFGGKVAFLRDYLLPALAKTNDSEGVYFEHCLASAAHRAIADGLSWSLCPLVPIVGISGTDNTSYNSSRLTSLKLFFKNEAKKFIYRR